METNAVRYVKVEKGPNVLLHWDLLRNFSITEQCLLAIEIANRWPNSRISIFML